MPRVSFAPRGIFVLVGVLPAYERLRFGWALRARKVPLAG